MNGKILVVDDSRMVRTIAGNALRAAGFEVLEACDGIEALAALDASPDIALVVSDVNMPNMSGIEFLEAHTSRPAPRAPVVMLTTESEIFLVQRAKALGARGWLFKPVRPDLLVAAVIKACARLGPNGVRAAVPTG